MEKKRMMTMILNITMITTADIVQQNKKKLSFSDSISESKYNFGIKFSSYFHSYSIPPKTNDIDKQTQYTDTH